MVMHYAAERMHSINGKDALKLRAACTKLSVFTDIDENENFAEPKLSNSVSIAEQEVCINFMRDEDFATIYTSDTTYMTKLDKLCNSSSDMYSLIADTGIGKTYRVEDKTLISFRAKKRKLSEEQKVAAGERMRQYQANKRG